MRKITEEQKQKAIEVYAEKGNTTKAAEAIGMNRKTLQREMARSKDFKEDMETAKAIYCDGLEEILDRRIRGTDIINLDKASALLLMFKLKAELPDKYREKVDHKIEGNIKIITGVPRPPTKE